MEADTLEAAVTIARGRPRLESATPSAVTWKVRTTFVLDEEARKAAKAAKARGVTVSQLVRDAVASYLRAG